MQNRIDQMKLKANIATMQSDPELQLQAAKDEKLTELEASNRELVRDVRRLIADAAEGSRHRDAIDSIWKRMRKMHNDQVKYLCAEIQEKDRQVEQRDAIIEEKCRQVDERDAVIRQLRDAIEKLEAALWAMTKVAREVTEAKKKARADLISFREKIRLLEKAQKDGSNVDMAYAVKAAQKTGVDLKARLSTKAVELEKLEEEKEVELKELTIAKSLLSMQLQAKQGEFQEEMFHVFRKRESIFTGFLPISSENENEVSKEMRLPTHSPQAAVAEIVPAPCTTIPAEARKTYLKNLFPRYLSTKESEQMGKQICSTLLSNKIPPIEKQGQYGSTSKTISGKEKRKPLRSINK